MAIVVLAALTNPTNATARADETARAEPVTIPFHQKKVDARRPHAHIEVEVPVFDHPRPAARAALAALIGRRTADLVGYTPAPGHEGDVTLSCDVAHATTTLVSLICRSTLEDGLISDREQGIGGAPGGPNVWSMLFVIDGDRVRDATLAELLVERRGTRAKIDEKVRATLLTSCPGWKLSPSSSISAFTVSADGVKFYFQTDAFDVLGDSDCDREVTLSRADLRDLFPPRGVLDRVLNKR
jgi:hypothetical protein